MQENNLAPPKPEALGKLFGVDLKPKPPSQSFQMPNLEQLNEDEFDEEERSFSQPLQATIPGLPNPQMMPSLT